MNRIYIRSAIVLGLALPVSALTVNGNTDVSATAYTTASVDPDAKGISNANANVTEGASTTLGAQIKSALGGLIGDSTLSSESETTSGEFGDVNVLVGATVHDASAGANVVLVTRANVDSNAVAARSVDISTVHSAADLKGYVAAEIKSDEKFDKISTSASEVAVTYKQNAKLFSANGSADANI